MAVSPALPMRLAGWCDFHASPVPKFGLAVFQPVDVSRGYWIQSVRPFGDVICGFDPLRGLGNDLNPVGADVEVFANVGNTAIHVFVDENGRTHFGSLSECRPGLQAFLERAEAWPAVALQVADLVGEEDEQALRTARMARLIEETSGTGAATEFLRGRANEHLWHGLVGKSGDVGERAEIWRRCRDIRISFAADGAPAADIPPAVKDIIGGDGNDVQEAVRAFCRSVSALRVGEVVEDVAKSSTSNRIDEILRRDRTIPVGTREELLVLRLLSLLQGETENVGGETLTSADPLERSLVARMTALQAREEPDDAASHLLKRLASPENHLNIMDLQYFAAKYLSVRPGLASAILMLSRS